MPVTLAGTHVGASGVIRALLECPANAACMHVGDEMNRPKNQDDKGPTRADDRPISRGSDSPRAGTARSGDFSQDPAFDPDQLFHVVSREENADRVAEAMRKFLGQGDVARFEQAVAVFVRSARARGESVERVLAVLIELAEAREGVAYPHDWSLTDLRWVVLRGVLLAFYGDTSLAAREAGNERRSGGERRRVADRPTGDREGEVF